MTRATAESSRFSEDYHFAAAYPGVFGREQVAIHDRRELHRRLNESCRLRPNLRRSFLEHPRAIFAVAVEESFGIHRSLFFVQIRDVEVIEEDRFTLGVVLTTCHLGCVAPRMPCEDESTLSACQICSHGEEPSASDMTRRDPPPADRDDLRWWIHDRAKADPIFREQLIESPETVWSQILTELSLPSDHPLCHIRTIRTCVESSETIGMVLDPDLSNETSRPVPASVC